MYMPSPVEEGYFEALWRVADASGAGSLGGGDAVKFFLNSGLQTPILKEIWSIADGQQKHILERAEFSVALRLIAMAQQGGTVSAAELARTASATISLPRFTGLPSAEVGRNISSTCLLRLVLASWAPAPLALLLFARGWRVGRLACARVKGWELTAEDCRKYAGLFPSYDPTGLWNALNQGAGALLISAADLTLIGMR